MLEIWLAFYMGQFVRAGQRASHVVAAEEERSWKGYFQKNWGRITIRAISSGAVFQWALLPLGWIALPAVAFMAGFNYEAIAEDVLNRVKDKGIAVLEKRKNGDTTLPPEKKDE